MSFGFEHFRDRYGSSERFEDFVVRTVKSQYPSAKPVRPSQGDWGIDGYVGRLSGGAVQIWQAKFFMDGVDDSQKAQIRESYETARDKAKEEGYTLVAWTLCLPIELSAKESKWWDKWSAEREQEDRVQMSLWDRSEFARLMATPDAADVRAEFFPHLDPVHELQPPEIKEPDDPDGLEEMLFVRQLREAGLTEVESAKEQFYNADLVLRELADKGLAQRETAFRNMQSDYRSTWEDRFNHHCSSEAPEANRLPELHPDVMERIDSSHDANPQQPFPLTRTHRKGALHHVVEDGDAGWTRNFRDVAKEHGNG